MSEKYETVPNKTESENVKRFIESLSNGQFLIVQVKKDIEGYGDIDIAIGDTLAEASKMIDDCSAGFDVSSGKCGLEGLRKALEIVDSLDPLDYGGVLFVQPSDEKRASAYRRLLKHGFVWNPENGCYERHAPSNMNHS